MAGLRVICQCALYYLVDLDASQMTQCTFRVLETALQAADTYGQNLSLPGTLTSSF